MTKILRKIKEIASVTFYILKELKDLGILRKKEAEELKRIKKGENQPNANDF